MAEEPVIGWSEGLGGEATNPIHPRTTGEKLFIDDEEYTVPTCENGIKAQFEDWVRGNTLREIARIDRTDSEEADRMRSAYNGDVGAGYYTWDGKHVRRARLDWPGYMHLLYLLLRRCHPNITKEKVGELMEKAPRDCGHCISWALGNARRPKEGAEGNGKMNTKTTKEPITLDS